MKRVWIGLAVLVLLASVGGVDAVDAVDFSTTAQCMDMTTPWTTTWQAGEVQGGDAFALMFFGDMLLVRGLPCGKGFWKISQVCLSAPEQVLWVMWNEPATSRADWGLPYAPEQIGVLGECVYGLDERWRPFPDVVRPTVAGPGQYR